MKKTKMHGEYLEHEKEEISASLFSLIHAQEAS